MRIDNRLVRLYVTSIAIPYYLNKRIELD